MADTKEDVDLLDQHIEKAIGDMQGRSRAFKRGCKALQSMIDLIFT